LLKEKKYININEIIPPNFNLGINQELNADLPNLDDLGSKRSLQENKKLDSLKPDP